MIYPASPEVKSSVRPAPRIGVPFAPIPLDLKARRDVSPAAKIVFATIANHARMRRGEVSNLTNRRLAEKTGLNVATVRRALDQLESLGLVRRLYGASQRIRLGIAVVYRPSEGCSPAAAPPQRVAHQPQPGCAPAIQGVAHQRATDLLRSREELKDAVPLSGGGTEDDPAAKVAEGPEAAAYLRAMIQAGRRGEPAPPVPSAPGRPAQTPTVRVEPPSGPQDDARRAVGQMVKDLAERFTTPGVVRRRPTYRQLDAKVAEMRRKHGKAAHQDRRER